jgi:WD40 repeat protein
MDSNFRLEGFHLKLEDFTSDKEEGELLTSVTMTPFLENCRTSLLLIGTSTGGILVVDKEKKNLIRKYYITKTPISKIIYFKDSLIVGGQSPIVYSWKFNQDKIDQENVLDFLEKEKSKLIFVEGSVTSMDFENGYEGLVGTNYGSIFFISFLNESSIKIISSHMNGFVNWVECERNNDYILSTGDDGTLRCWTQNSFDQKFQFTKVLDSKCDMVLLNPMENLSVALYDNSYLRVFNMKSLKSIGKLKIPDHDINNISFIFNYQGLILTTLQDKVYVLDVQNWEPLNVLYTEVENNFMPKNQFFKSVDTKNFSGGKSLAVMSFSDGTSVVLKIYKEKGKVETIIIDKFNMFEYHISKSDDVHIAEMYQNLTKYRVS